MHEQIKYKIRQGITAVVFVAVVAAGCKVFVDGLCREADIAAAVAEAKRKERERIYTANLDIIAGHEEYIRDVEKRIAAAYRQPVQ